MLQNKSCVMILGTGVLLLVMYVYVSGLFQKCELCTELITKLLSSCMNTLS